MCGKNSQLFKTSIEGAILRVCKTCSSYGKVLGKVKTEEELRTKKKKQAQIVHKEEPEKLELIKEDYADIIRKAREKLDMKQEDFAKKVSEKESIIHKIETGSFKPSLKTARKFENILNIKLTEEVEDNFEQSSNKKSEGLTLGDFIKKKK